MTNEDLNQEEEVQKTTPPTESESEDSEIDELFNDENDELEEPAKEDDKVAKLEKEIADLKKGIAKAFSEKGREQKEVIVEKQQPQFAEELLTIKYPEAEFVMDELQEEAKRTGKDVLSIFKGSTFLKSESKARAETKRIEEENKAKINKPSSDVDFSKRINSIKEEDLKKLTPAERVKWLELQVKKEQSRNIE